MPEKGMEAGKYPFFPPLIHAPCSLKPMTPTTTAPTPLSPPAGGVFHGEIHTIN